MPARIFEGICSCEVSIRDENNDASECVAELAAEDQI